MAGTGKSTISRTAAESLAEANQLAASFFFKRGEGDRGNASMFFTTIAAQLVLRIPSVMRDVGRVLENNPDIATKSFQEQFEKLVLHPLRETKLAFPVVVVIDALDECENENDIKRILHILRLANGASGSVALLRIFLTSRPDLAIRLGFKKLPDVLYQELVLQNIARSTIEQDILTYLRAEFEAIRCDHDDLEPDEELWLGSDWPGEEKIQILVRMATPLFIFAATVCRFIRESTADPEKRLKVVLHYKKRNWGSIENIYMPVLNQLLADGDLTDSERDEKAREFRNIIGPIILLADPLSTTSISRLLGIPRKDIANELKSLHSVLDVPSKLESPVRLLHLSFRDFLLDKQKSLTNPFWIDEKATNESLARNCVEQMSSSGSLRQDICGLGEPGKQRIKIDEELIKERLPAHICYACRYWVHHLEQCGYPVKDNDFVHEFLKTNFLYWLEALTLIGVISESIYMINNLQSLVHDNRSTHVAEFLQDAKRFILMNRGIVDSAPLQLYSSAILFAPERSIIKNQFRCLFPRWIRAAPKVESSWGVIMQTVGGHDSSRVEEIALSPDGRLIASADWDKSLTIWDVITSTEQIVISRPSGLVKALAFSPDGKFITAGVGNKVMVWDAVTGAANLESEELSSHELRGLAVSLDKRLVAFRTSDRIGVWDMDTNKYTTLQEGFHAIWGKPEPIVFSPDGQMIASDDGRNLDIQCLFSNRNMFRVWRKSTTEEWTEFDALSHTSERNTRAIAFSPDGQLVALGNEAIVILNTHTGDEHARIEIGQTPVGAIAFSPDGEQIASCSRPILPHEVEVRLWDLPTRRERAAFRSHFGSVITIAFLSEPTGLLVASASYEDGTMALWDTTTREMGDMTSHWGHRNLEKAVAFSPDGKPVASGLCDKTKKSRDSHTATECAALGDDSNLVLSVEFSPDGCQLASISYTNKAEGTISLWDVATASKYACLRGHKDMILGAAFSPNGFLIVSSSEDKTIKLWDASPGRQRSPPKSALGSSRGQEFLRNRRPNALVSVSDLADAGVEVTEYSSRELATLEGHQGPVSAVTFSCDGQLIASGSDDKTVRIWDVATKAVLAVIETTYEKIPHLSFKYGDSRIDTSHGPVYISQARRKGINPSSSSLSLRKPWVYWGEENILRLPPNYRPTADHIVATKGNTFAIGHTSGEVLFLEFDLKELK